MRIEDIFSILKAIRAKSPDYNLGDIQMIFTSYQCNTPSLEVLRKLTDALKDADEPKLDSAALWAEIMEDSFEEEALSQYGFQSDEELNSYRRLKPFFILSAYFENNEQSVMLAYKLIVAFGDDVKALAYIQQFEKIQPKNMTPVHDATLFNLPVGTWDLTIWREMNEKYLLNDEYLKAFSLANKVEEFHKALQQNNDSLELQKLVEEEVQRTTANTIQKTKDKASSEFNNLRKSLTNPESNTFYTEQEYIEVHRAIQKNSLTRKQQQLKELREKSGTNDVKVTQLEKDIAAITFDEVKVAQTYQDGVKKVTSGLAVYLQMAVNKKTNEIARHEAQVGENIRRSYMAPLENLGPDTLFKIALLSGYNRASENQLAAQMLIPLGVPEDLFNKYLDLVKMNPPQNSDALLPKVCIDGEAYHLPGYFMCKLDDDDPRGAFLGYPTGCCQNLGSTGATSAIYGVTQSNSGFYIVVKGKLPSDLESSKSIPTRSIVAQTWAWRNENSNIMVFDSLERNKSKISGEVMLPLFMGIAIHIQKRDPSIEQIYVGKTYELMDYKAAPASLALKYPQTEMPYRGYTDARHQFIFLDRDNPWPYFAYYAPLFCFNLVKLGLPLSPEEAHELAASFLTNMLWQDESKFNQDIFSWALTHCSPTYFHEEIMGNIPLFFAAKRRNIKAFNILWERYTTAEILGRNKSGQTLLHVVEHLTMLENILSKLTAPDVKVMLNASNNLRQTALYCAASNPEIFLKLLPYYSTEDELWAAANRQNYDSYSAMRLCSMSTVVDKLIEVSKTKSPEVIVALFNQLSKERKLKLLETKRIMEQLAGSTALLPILQSLQDDSVAKGLIEKNNILHRTMSQSPAFVPEMLTAFYPTPIEKHKAMTQEDEYGKNVLYDCTDGLVLQQVLAYFPDDPAKVAAFNQEGPGQITVAMRMMGATNLVNIIFSSLDTKEAKIALCQYRNQHGDSIISSAMGNVESLKFLLSYVEDITLLLTFLNPRVIIGQVNNPEGIKTLFDHLLTADTDTNTQKEIYHRLVQDESKVLAVAIINCESFGLILNFIIKNNPDFFINPKFKLRYLLTKSLANLDTLEYFLSQIPPEIKLQLLYEPVDGELLLQQAAKLDAEPDLIKVVLKAYPSEKRREVLMLKDKTGATIAGRLNRNQGIFAQVDSKMSDDESDSEGLYSHFFD